MKSKFSVTTLWDSRVVNSKKESRIMLSIGLNKERFKISLKLYSTKVDYDKAIGGRSLSIHQERTIRIGWKNEKEEN